MFCNLAISLLSSKSFCFCWIFWIFYIDDHVICKQKQFVFLSQLENCGFLFLSYCLAGTSSMMLKRHSEKGHPCLVPDLGGKAFSFSLLNVMWAVGFLLMFLIKLKEFSSIPSFVRIFNHERMLYFLKCFLHLDMIIWFFFFSLLTLGNINWWITLIDF